MFFESLAVALIATFFQLDMLCSQTFAFMYVLPSWLVGVVLGDPMTGLQMGATVQLMSFGVAGLGGSSVPDYNKAGMIGTAIAILTGQDFSVGLAVGIAVGMLFMQADIVCKIFNGFVGKWSQNYARQGNYKMMIRTIYLGPIVYGLFSFVPVFIAVYFGVDIVNLILEAMPAWFTTGLSVAGGMLPVVGMAMLLTYMPAKKFISFLIVGYVLASYVGLAVLPIALIGIACAYEYYKLHANDLAAATATVAMEGELEDE